MTLEPIVPFEPVATGDYPADGEWTAQIKWDGVRILTYCQGGEVRLFNRRLNERTLQFPELTADPASYCSAGSFVLDGEMIAFESGKPSFHEVMRRDGVKSAARVAEARRAVPVTYMIFDVLYCNGEWVTGRPLRERLSLLEGIVKPSEGIQVVAGYDNPADLFKVAERHELEGIVMKELGSKYAIGGKDKRWLKKKIYLDLIAVVGGVTYRDGIVNALLLGLYDEAGSLWYIGHAGGGRVKAAEWRTLTEWVAPLKVPRKPFVNRPERMKDAHWLAPVVTVKIKYLEWTAGRAVRQPSIEAFVETPPHTCTFSQVTGVRS